MLDSIFDPQTGPITRQKIDDSLALTGYFICALQRTYSKIATGESRAFFSTLPTRAVRERAELTPALSRFAARPGTMDYYDMLPRFWTWVDSAHTAVQSLHRRLVALQAADIEVPDSDHDVEYDLLIAVRMDARLIDLLNLAHEWLRGRLGGGVEGVDGGAGWEGEERRGMKELFQLSEKRVRKCLKLLAFYSKVRAVSVWLGARAKADFRLDPR